MAKSKIIWSGRAKKNLYNILEFYIRRDKNKTYSKGIYNALYKNIKTLRKNPYKGLITNKESVYGLLIESCLICYEISDQRIVIHSVIPK